MFRAMTAIILVLFIASDLLAWSAAGHKIIASIAFRQLTASQQSKITGLLKKHPRFDQDFKNKMPNDVESGADAVKNEWIFQQAAIWPDLARGFRDAGLEKYHRPNWHYINLPHFLTDADRSALEGRLETNLKIEPPTGAEKTMNVVQALRFARKLMTKPDAAAAEKAVMLTWVFHNIGDIRQPLHSTALCSRKLFPKGDRGGNSVLTQQRGNRHALWDKFLGDSAHFSTASKKAKDLVNDARLSGLGKSAAENLNEKVWLDESHLLAIAAAYDPDIMVFLRELEADNHDGELPEIALSTPYLQGGGRLANRRVVEAGYRLGAVLKGIAGE